MTTVPFASFAQIDIRIGTIREVSVVPDADKLLVLTVDFGAAEPRQIVSGIREFYPDPTALVGAQAPFVVNLEPRTIRGYESQGMILAASPDGEGFVRLLPEAPVAPGTPIR